MASQSFRKMASYLSRKMAFQAPTPASWTPSCGRATPGLPCRRGNLAAGRLRETGDFPAPLSVCTAGMRVFRLVLDGNRAGGNFRTPSAPAHLHLLPRLSADRSASASQSGRGDHRACLSNASFFVSRRSFRSHPPASRGTKDSADNTILGEHQRGYNFKGKLLRPSMVKVAVRS